MTDRSRTDSSPRADTRGRPESPAPDEDSACAEHTAAGATTADTADLNALLVNSLQDYAVFALDRAGHILSWNAGAARIKGYTASEIIGRHFSIFYPPEDVAAGLPFRALAIAREEGRFEHEGWRVRKDGTRFWASVVITVLRGPDGALVGFAKVTRDLTERRAATERTIADARRLASEETARRAAEESARALGVLAEQLRQQAAELERQKVSAEVANRVKADFLAAMSHELRTPLNAIGGYAEILALGLRGPLTAEQLQDIERIRRSQQHLLGIINDILNFSRLEAGKVTYDLRPVPMADVVNEVAALMAPQSMANGLAYEFGECPTDAVALADRAKTAQILLNLLSNAMKYTYRGGRVAVTCSVTEAQVVIAVRDTGRGIPTDKLDAIFDPFVQVGRNLTHPGEGTGLGLAISRDLARGMGGDLTVESAEGLGSTFTLALPRAPR